jgi:hypothetical protein
VLEKNRGGSCVTRDPTAPTNPRSTRSRMEAETTQRQRRSHPHATGHDSVVSKARREHPLAGAEKSTSRTYLRCSLDPQTDDRIPMVRDGQSQIVSANKRAKFWSSANRPKNGVERPEALALLRVGVAPLGDEVDSVGRPLGWRHTPAWTSGQAPAATPPEMRPSRAGFGAGRKPSFRIQTQGRPFTGRLHIPFLCRSARARRPVLDGCARGGRDRRVSGAGTRLSPDDCAAYLIDLEVSGLLLIVD